MRVHCVMPRFRLACTSQLAVLYIASDILRHPSQHAAHPQHTLDKYFVTMQVAAATVYFEWQKGVQASEAKKAQERQARADWEAAAEHQRQVRFCTGCCLSDAHHSTRSWTASLPCVSCALCMMRSCTILSCVLAALRAVLVAQEDDMHAHVEVLGHHLQRVLHTGAKRSLSHCVRQGMHPSLLCSCVQQLTEQNAKQFEVIFGIRDRLAALEEQVQALQGSK